MQRRHSPRHRSRSPPPRAPYTIKDTKRELRESGVGPNYNKSGSLSKEANKYNGVVLKYSEPAEARKCPSKQKRRLYIFKGHDHIDTIQIYKQSAYLLGKDRNVCDIPFDHASISSQHCVLQYRQIVKTNEFGEATQKIKLYIIDLESSNGTFVNNEKIPQSRYYEVKIGDVIKLGASTREIVLMAAPEEE